MPDDCHEVLRELEVYLDGECPDDLEALVARHLRACSPCTDRAEFERGLRAVIAAKCTDCAPAGLLERVKAQLRVLS